MTLPGNVLDRACLLRLRTGDREVLGQLLAQHEPFVRRLIRRHVTRVQPYVEDDLLQEVSLRICKTIGRFNGRCSFKTWLRQPTFQACMTYLRQAAKRREAQLLIEGQDWETVDPPEEREYMLPREPSSDPAFIERLWQAIAQLPESQQQVIRLFAYEGRSYSEVSALTGVNAITLKTRFFRARQVLTAQLSPP